MRHLLAAGSLLLGVSACQRDSKLALDRPYTDSFANLGTFTHDLEDIQRERSLDSVQWQHLRMYTALAPTNSAMFPLTGITYRRASYLIEKHFYSQAAQDSVKELTKNLPTAPPLLPDLPAKP